MISFKSIKQLTMISFYAGFIAACSSETETEVGIKQTPFSLNFAVMNGTETVSCGNNVAGFGEEGNYSIGLSDLRLYVSNIKFYDQYNEEVTVEFDSNDFQLNHEQGFVGLVDLTSNTEGSCTGDGIEFSEGTARTNHTITGNIIDTGVSKLTFDIGVPQAVMKDVIATQSAEDAPSPLNEMYWSWASGYRHFVMNFAIQGMHGANGEGYIHIGSRGCGGEGLLALENKPQCDFVNSPKVEINQFDINNNLIKIQLADLLADLAFAPTMDSHGSHEGGDEMMDKPSVSCHSASPEMQPDCGVIFANFGLSADDGTADAQSNMVIND